MFADIVAESLDLDTTLRPDVLETHLTPRPAFDQKGLTVYAKLENQQRTGSFKLRGATAKVASLTSAELAAGVVTASTGNHGAAVATAGAAAGCAVEVFVPQDADAAKVARIRQLGAIVTAVAGDPVSAESAARAAAVARGSQYLSPYNDTTVVAGQGTIGVELSRQLETADAVFVSVGGGGLISGVAATVRSVWPAARVVGCSAANSAAMHHSVAAGTPIEVAHLDTLSDGTAGGIEPDTVTFDMCRALVDDWVLVSEEAIAAAMRRYMAAYADRIEGSAAVALAALQHIDVAGNVVVVICGGNVSAATLRSVGVAV